MPTPSEYLRIMADEHRAQAEELEALASSLDRTSVAAGEARNRTYTPARNPMAQASADYTPVAKETVRGTPIEEPEPPPRVTYPIYRHNINGQLPEGFYAMMTVQTFEIPDATLKDARRQAEQGRQILFYFPHEQRPNFMILPGIATQAMQPPEWTDVQ